MNKSFFAALIILAAGLVILPAACAGQVENVRQLRSAVESLQGISQSKLLNLNNAVSKAAGKIAVTGLEGKETREILNGLCSKYPYLIDCTAADPQGKMITVAPEEYRRFEGTDTATTEASKKFFSGLGESKKPVLSDVFTAVEGIDAVVVIWPVVTDEGEMIGSVSALFKPESMLGVTIGSAAKIRAMEVIIMQTDGRTIYSSNGSETDTNLLTDPKYKDYPELVAMGMKMAAEKTGTAEYTYLSDTTGKPVRKTAFWTTIGLHDTEWRMVGIAELEK